MNSPTMSGMADEPVQGFHGKRRMRVGTVAQIQINLAQPKKIEMIDDPGTVKRDAPTEGEQARQQGNGQRTLGSQMTAGIGRHCQNIRARQAKKKGASLNRLGDHNVHQTLKAGRAITLCRTPSRFANQGGVDQDCLPKGNRRSRNQSTWE